MNTGNFVNYALAKTIMIKIFFFITRFNELHYDIPHTSQHCNANQDLSAFVSKDVVETTSIIIHPLLIQDYMEDSHGKEINLMQTTVKIPGQHKPRLNTQLSNGSANDQSGNF